MAENPNDQLKTPFRVVAVNSGGVEALILDRDGGQICQTRAREFVGVIPDFLCTASNEHRALLKTVLSQSRRLIEAERAIVEQNEALEFYAERAVTQQFPSPADKHAKTVYDKYKEVIGG